MDYNMQRSLAAYRTKQASEVPREPHFVIILYETKFVDHEGDERSRTHPGHGYPAYTETINSITHHVFKKHEKGQWEEFVIALYNDNPKRTDMVAFEVASVAQPKLSVTL